MKLITKASYYFLLTCLVSVVLSTFLGKIFFNKMMSQEANEQLNAQKIKIERFVVLHKSLPNNELTLSDSLFFNKTNKLNKSETKDTLIYDYIEKENLNYRKLTFTFSLNNNIYQATILKPLYVTEDLTEAIIFSLGLIMLTIMGALFVVNYFISKKLWQPFYDSLNRLKSFKITQEEALTFTTTNISEFSDLQQNLSQLTEKVRSDYQALKGFTENASHELQTPLSVIGTNLEMLIQGENLNVDQLQQISQLIDELGKVSKLNQTLLLLTKIENRQFGNTEKLNVSKVIKVKLEFLKSWISHKNIHLNTEVKPDVIKEINPYLLDVLLNNIISNAIKHNEENGEINIKLTESTFEVTNTGLALNKTPKELFERFQKDKANSDSMGLGLSIVKLICETYGFEVEYLSKNKNHNFKITF